MAAAALAMAEAVHAAAEAACAAKLRARSGRRGRPFIFLLILFETAGSGSRGTKKRLVVHSAPGLKIRNTNIIDISYLYFGLVLGCIDADLCKKILLLAFF